MIIHGELDTTFPLAFAQNLAESFRPNSAKLWIAKGAGHSDSSLMPGYENTVGEFLKENLQM